MQEARLTHSRGYKSALSNSPMHSLHQIRSRSRSRSLSNSPMHQCATFTHKSTNQPSNECQTPQSTQRCFKSNQNTLTRLQLQQLQPTMHPSAQSALIGSQCANLSTNSMKEHATSPNKVWSLSKHNLTLKCTQQLQLQPTNSKENALQDFSFGNGLTIEIEEKDFT